MIQLCPLCSNPGNSYAEYKTTHYLHCPNCHAVFMDEKDRPDNKAEKSRYELHQNNLEDKNYQKFVSPITSAILREFTKESKGLDFGAGKDPIISKVLQDSDFRVFQYDPYFYNDEKLLQEKYDYIACCEVIEHFYNPHKEFLLLKKLLKPNSKLYCMTDLYDENRDFSSWYYKNDATHVFFYHKKTFDWIKKKFGFLDVVIEGRLISLSV
ncbi:MAG: class I SAM-dependent methyltransferase [Sulfurimonas sp.]